MSNVSDDARVSRRTLLNVSATAVAASALGAAVAPGAAGAHGHGHGNAHGHGRGHGPRPGHGSGGSGSVFEPGAPPPPINGYIPTPLAPGVAAAMATPPIPQTDPAYVAMFRSVERLAARALETERDVLMMQAEAIISLEAAFRALVRPGIKALNLINGPYAAGYTTWMREYGAEVVELVVPYNASIDPAAVEASLAANPGVELVSVVHVDTPCGTANDIERIGPIAKRHGAVTLVDAATTVGGMPVRTDAWKLDIVVGATQKCLGATSGIGVMSVSDDAWALIAKNPNAPSDSYLSMTDWKTRWLEGGSFPLGTDCTGMYGMKAALRHLFDAGGLEASFARHRRAGGAFRAGAEAMGLTLWPAPGALLCDATTTLALPDGLAPADVVARVRRYGVAIAGGQVSGGGVSGGTIRVGHLGVLTDARYVLAILEAVGRAMGSLGVAVDVKRGLRVARRALGRR